MRHQFLRAAATTRLTFSPATTAWLVDVEDADLDGGQPPLEDAVYNAMGVFADWRIPLGGACCLMAGPRTLAGALVPMVGPVPTEVNFVSGDYNRKTGLIGSSGDQKRIDSNVKLPQTAGAQDSHMSLHGTENLNTGRAMGVHRSSLFTRHYLLGGLGNTKTWGNMSTTTVRTSGHLITTRLTGGDPLLYFDGVLDVTLNTNNSVPSDWNVGVFVSNGSATGVSSETAIFSNYSDARLTHYSIGPGLTSQQCTDFHALISAINTTMSALP